MIAQANVRKLPLAANSVDMIFADPPYPKKFVHVYRWLALEAQRVLKPGGFVLAMCGGLLVNKIYQFFDYAGLDHFFMIGHKSNGQSPAVWMRHENNNYPLVARLKTIVCYSKGPGRPRAGCMLNIFESEKTSGWSKRWHHWGQDINSARYYIEHFTAPGDLVLDPFMGGGTTAVACAISGRRCLGFDIKLSSCITSRQRLNGADIPFDQGLFESEGQSCL